MKERSMRVSSRRSVLGAAVAAGGGVLAAPVLSACDSAATESAGTGQAGPAEQARESFTVVDKRGQQGLLVSTSKPQVRIGGRTLPASDRQGPDPATYVIFNDENESERGGITASANSASFSLDYANAQAITIGTQWSGKDGGAALSMSEMPDPEVPVERARTVQRAVLQCRTGQGAMLALHDSKGRQRIVLEVDGDDVPRIKILDDRGAVVSQLPPR